jgi:hypothetical protein
MTGETPTPPDLTDGKVNRIAAVSKRPLPAMFLRATKSPSSRVRALSRSSWTTPSLTSVKSVVSPGSPQSIDPLVLLRGLDSWFLGIPRLRRGVSAKRTHFQSIKTGLSQKNEPISMATSDAQPRASIDHVHVSPKIDCNFWRTSASRFSSNLLRTVGLDPWVFASGPSLTCPLSPPISASPIWCVSFARQRKRQST